MRRAKFSKSFEGELLARLKDKWSHSTIVSHYKRQGIVLNSSYLTRLQERKENVDQPYKIRKKPGPKPALSSVS